MGDANSKINFARCGADHCQTNARIESLITSKRPHAQAAPGRSEYLAKRNA